MGLIEEIQDRVSRRQYEFTKHAVDQSIMRDISVAEVDQAILDSGALIIEDYPADKYGPSCLVLGFAKAGRPLHVQCGYHARPLLKIITLGQPDPELWVDLRVRKTGGRGG